MALTLAFAKHDVADQTRLREQMDQVRDGGAALARVDCLLVLYADERQISFGSADDSRLTSAIRCVKVRPRHRPRSRGHHGRHCNFHIAWRRSSGRWPAGCVSPGVDMNLHDAAMTDLPFAGSLADPLAAALRVVLDVGQMRQFRAHQPATDTHCDA